MQSHDPQHDEGRITNVCPHCNGTDIFNDRDSGERVCKGCGTVLSETLIDHGQERRSFSSEEHDSRSRTAVDKDMMNESSHTTFNVNDIKDGEQKAQFIRHQWNTNRIVKNTTRVKNFAKAKMEIYRMCSQLGYDDTHIVTKTAARTYMRAFNKGLSKGRPIDGMVAASIKAAWREIGIERSLDNAADVSKTSRKLVARMYRMLLEELNIKTPAPDPRKRLPKIASSVGADRSVEALADRILSKAADLKITAGKDPGGLAGSALYISATFNSKGRTRHTLHDQKEIADAAGVTEVTIRNRYKEMNQAFKDNGITVEGLSEGLPKLPIRSKAGKKANVKPVPVVSEKYIKRMDELARKLGLDDEVVNRAYGIYQTSIGEIKARLKYSDAMMDASLALAMQLYSIAICPEDTIAAYTNGSADGIKKMSTKMKYALRIEMPDIDFSEYVRYISGKLGIDGSTQDVILALLREYEPDNGTAIDKMYIAAGAVRKVTMYSEEMLHTKKLTLSRLAHACLLNTSDVYKGLKEMEGYDVGKVIARNGIVFKPE